MHVNKVREAGYVVCLERTVILITLNYNVNIWNEIWRIIKEKFDVQCSVRPKNIPVYKKELCNILHKYVKEESEFIMEVPKVKGYIPDILHLCTEIQLYRSVYTARKQSCNYLQFIEDLNEVVHAITDTDREYNKKYSNHMPIAYALVGNSLSMDKFRNMLDQVSNVCKSKGVDILCRCCNGQFQQIVCKTKNSESLTWIAWQKDLWNTSMKMSKRDLLKSLESVCKVDDEMLNLGSENIADEFTYTFQNLTF